MGNDSNTFTIALPEMRKYKMLDVPWRLLFLVFWILWGVISFGNVEAPWEIRFAIKGGSRCPLRRVCVLCIS